MALAPGWLDAVSRLMPFRCPVDAVREAYIGHYTTPAMLSGLLVAVALTVFAVTVGTRAFRSAGA